MCLCACVKVTKSHTSLTQKHATLTTGGLEVDAIQK